MDHLIVPTDFSTVAQNALDYAIDLANQLESKITLIHCLDFNQTNDLWGVQLKLKQEAEQELAAIKKTKQNQLFGSTILESKVLNGGLLEELKRMDQSQSVDLIIMGTEGAGDLEAWFLETNTVSVLNETSIPLLVIPDQFKYSTLKEVAFFVDKYEVKQKTLLPLRQITLACKAHLSVYHLIDLFEAVGVVDTDLSTPLKGLSYDLIQTEQWVAINTTIDQVITESKADLLCMIKRDRGWLENLLHMSKTAQKAAQALIPLLVLHQIP